MDLLRESAIEFAKLFKRYFTYTLDDGSSFNLFFAPHHFHHLLGLQKLADKPEIQVNLPKGNSAAYIFKKILTGKITLEDIKTSKYFNEIELRLRHFKQINRIAETTEIIFEFDPTLINSKGLQTGRILFKMSNDNLYLNLIIKIDAVQNDFYIPYTFIPRHSDDYTHRQKSIKISSRTVIKRT